MSSRAVVGIKSTSSLVHDAIGFGLVWVSMSKQLKIKRVHADKAYWSENILGFLNQEGIMAAIPCKANSKDHGTDSAMDRQVRFQKRSPGLYRRNHRVNRRSAVEHTFGNIKLKKPILRDTTMRNKTKTLLCSFLWYNHELKVKEVMIEN